MFKLKKLPDYTLVSPLGHKIFSWNAIWWFFITHFTPSSSAAPQTAGEAVWGFSRISSSPRGECWASLDVWALRRKAREGSVVRLVVRLAMVATNGLVDGSLIWWWRLGGKREEGLDKGYWCIFPNHEHCFIQVVRKWGWDSRQLLIIMEGFIHHICINDG